MLESHNSKHCLKIIVFKTTSSAKSVLNIGFKSKKVEEIALYLVYRNQISIATKILQIKINCSNHDKL